MVYHINSGRQRALMRPNIIFTVSCSCYVPSVGSHRVTPFNVTVRELSESSALVTWSLFADQEEDDQMDSTNQTTENPMMPFRLEITYRPYRQRLLFIILAL